MLNGLVVGSLGAICAGFLMRRWNLLSGVSPLDTVTHTAATLLLAFASLLAAYIPARRVMGVRPAEALRCE
jgi:ABC-type lipoprotein release transport system permease subunit